MKYIIDTDPGIDDAIAIMLAKKNNLDILGFTLSSGNIELSKAENNLKVIMNVLNIKADIHKGFHQNKLNESTAEFAHGKDGLGYTVFPKMGKKVSKVFAEDFIIKASKKYKDNLTLICLGPLTNLACALKKDKKLAKRLKHVVIMGATYAPNSSEKYKEFNVTIDPKAAKIVFESQIEDIRVVTHELGVKSFIEREYIDNLKYSEDRHSRFLNMIAEKYMDFSYEHYGTVGLGTPDPTTIASIISDDIVKFCPATIDVVSTGDNRGECNVSLTDKSNILISVDFDLEKFRELFKKTFS